MARTRVVEQVRIHCPHEAMANVWVLLKLAIVDYVIYT